MTALLPDFSVLMHIWGISLLLVVTMNKDKDVLL